MLRPRVIPVLLVKDGRLITTVGFKRPNYVGDPLNAVRIFNEKEVDELILLDVAASAERRPPRLEFIEDVAGECFMPLCYGGGVRSLEEIRRLLRAGVERVSLNTRAVQDPGFVEEAAREFGSSTIVVSIDVKKSIFGRYVVHRRDGSWSSVDPIAFAARMVELGAGEILVNAVDRDGSMLGYDTKLIRLVSDAVSVPVIACGGAGTVADLTAAFAAHAAAAAAGSMFVYQGRHRAVLISYPTQQELRGSPGNPVALLEARLK